MSPPHARRPGNGGTTPSTATARPIGGTIGRVGWLALALLAACQDLRDYTGTWHGPVASDPVLAHGFAPAATITAQITSAGRDSIALSLTLPGGRTARFVPIRRAAGDVLADVQLPGEPLRTFFGFVQDDANGDPALPGYLAVVSLFPDSRIELRLIRGSDDAYGVFALRRVPDRTGPPPAAP